MQVTIDGPVGSGKSTVSRELAKRLGFIYVDTGALYRTVGLYVKNNNGLISEEESVKETIDGKLNLEIKLIDGFQYVFANSVDFTDKIRTPEVSMLASDISKLPFVRNFLLEIQRKIAETKDVIMDGRDIGTVILPNAEVKIYLTASDEIRAGRRYKELIEKSISVTFDEVLADLQKRDYNDMNRETAPLKPANDAIIIDSSQMTFEEVIEKISKIIYKKKED